MWTWSFLGRRMLEHEQEQRETREHQLGKDRVPQRLSAAASDDFDGFEIHRGKSIPGRSRTGHGGTGELGVERGRDRLRPEADEEERGEQDERRDFFVPPQVDRRVFRDNLRRELRRRPEEHARRGTQPVDRRDDHAGDGQRGDGVRKFPQRDEDREFTPEIRQAGQADAGERAGDEECREGTGALSASPPISSSANVCVR